LGEAIERLAEGDPTAGSLLHPYALHRGVGVRGTRGQVLPPRSDPGWPVSTSRVLPFSRIGDLAYATQLVPTRPTSTGRAGIDVRPVGGGDASRPPTAPGSARWRRGSWSRIPVNCG
jgi:hypothetical protein